MRVRRAVLVLAALALAAVPGARAEEARQRGVAWVAGRDAIGAEDLAPLLRNHVDWIAQTPFGWQETVETPEIRMATSGHVWWGESDAGLAATARLARERGVKTLLKPHLWLRQPRPGQWLDAVAMRSEADWQRWFGDYRAFLLHYARLAEREGMEALAVGTELHQAAAGREADWRRLIAEVRQVYGGRLTYCANWHREYEEVRFWDALDFIGVQAYFPLSAGPQPTLEELLRGWQEHLPALERLARRAGKPIVFTEIGYKSTPDSTVRPWEWPQRGATPPVDAETQARAYEAFFRTFWHRPWFAGVYFWKWYPKARGDEARLAADFSPQGKPAEQVLARWFAAPRAAAAASSER
jgi:hypothetical protein